MGNLSIALFKHERIVTTHTKAKALRGTAEKLITLGKRGDLHARRQVMKVISEKMIVKKIFDNLAPRFSDRNGGYTRVMKIAPRRGDGAEMAIIELVDFVERQREAEVAAEKAKTTKSKKAKAVKTKETKVEKPKAKADKAGEEGTEKQEKAKEAKPDKKTKAKIDKSKKEESTP
jgi:large subunit ribosomal protein L17